MTAAQPKLPPMTVAEFLDWPGDGTGRRHELVDGELRAQDPASDAHGTIQSRLVALLTGHLDKTRPHCRVVTAPGIQPHLRADWNYRVPELAVTCAPNRADVHNTPDPVLVIEVLSPSNARDTWSNVPLFASLPTVSEILIVDSTKVAAELLRRGPDGTWPPNPEPVGPGGAIRLDSIGLEVAIAEAYRGTHLAGV
jgi:Uma2 family endonuclease